jgi:hypothetical protein
VGAAPSLSKLPTRLSLYNQGPVCGPSVAIAVTVTLLERSRASPQELMPRRKSFKSRDLTPNPKYHVMWDKLLSLGVL